MRFDLVGAGALRSGRCENYIQPVVIVRSRSRGHAVLTVIPARLESIRLPQKLLELIHGKPLIYWVANRIRIFNGSDFIVATDSSSIAEVCEQESLPFIMTSEDCVNGSERVYEAACRFPQYSHFLNVQGDEPLVNLELLEKLLKTVGENDHAFKTAVTKLHFGTNDPTEVKVAMQHDNRIRYASRSYIPYGRDSTFPTFKIHGVYLYTREVLERFVGAPAGPLEQVEQVEQLRCIENDIELYGVRCPSSPKSIDTLEDLNRYRKIPASAYEVMSR